MLWPLTYPLSPSPREGRAAVYPLVAKKMITDATRTPTERMSVEAFSKQIKLSHLSSDWRGFCLHTDN